MEGTQSDPGADRGSVGTEQVSVEAADTSGQRMSPSEAARSLRPLKKSALEAAERILRRITPPGGTVKAASK